MTPAEADDNIKSAEFCPLSAAAAMDVCGCCCPAAAAAGVMRTGSAAWRVATVGCCEGELLLVASAVSLREAHCGREKTIRFLLFKSIS